MGGTPRHSRVAVARGLEQSRALVAGPGGGGAGRRPLPPRAGVGMLLTAARGGGEGPEGAVGLDRGDGEGGSRGGGAVGGAGDTANMSQGRVTLRRRHRSGGGRGRARGAVTAGSGGAGRKRGGSSGAGVGGAEEEGLVPRGMVHQARTRGGAGRGVAMLLGELPLVTGRGLRSRNKGQGMAHDPCTHPAPKPLNPSPHNPER